MTNEDVNNLAKRLAVRITKESIKAKEGDGLAEIESLESVLRLIFDFIAKVDDRADTSILTRSLGELANIKSGAKAQFIKSYAILDNRPSKPQKLVERAILVVAQELLHAAGMTLKDAREYIAKRSHYEPKQLNEHRKRIRSNGVNTSNADEKETYHRFMETAQGKPPKETADALIVLATTL